MKIARMMLRLCVLTLGMSGVLYGQTTPVQPGGGDEITAETLQSKNVGDLPFLKSIPLPAGMRNFLRKISFTNPKTNPVTNGTEFTERVTIDQLAIQVKIRNLNVGGVSQQNIFIALPNGFRFSMIDAKLKPLDALVLNKVAIVIAKSDYKDDEWDIQINKGLNFVAEIQANVGFMKDIARVVPGINRLLLQGTITPDIYGSVFKATLPGQINMGKLGHTTGLTLSLYLQALGLGIGISTGLVVNIPNQAAPVTLIGEFTIQPPKLSVAGTMKGMLENAFGLKGLALGDFYIQVDTDLAVAAATSGVLALSGFCAGGKIAFGAKSVSLYGCLNFSTQPTMFLIGEVQGGLYLEDVIALGVQVAAKAGKLVGGNIDPQKVAQSLKGKVPRLGFKTAKVHIVPQDMIFMGQTYEKGVLVDVVAEILSTQAGMRVKIDDAGIDALGYLKNFKIGPLSISGAGADRKAGTPDDSAVIQLRIYPAKMIAEFYIDGIIKVDVLGGIEAGARIDLSTQGLALAAFIDIFKQYKARFELTAKGSVSPADKAQAGGGDLKNETNWSVALSFEQNALDNIGKELQKFFKGMYADAVKELDKRRREVTDLESKKRSLDGQIKLVEDQIAARIKQNQAAIEKAQRDVASIRTSRENLDKTIASCKGKAPDKADQLEAIKAGKPLSPPEQDALIAQFHRDYPNASPEMTEAVVKRLRALSTIVTRQGPFDIIQTTRFNTTTKKYDIVTTSINASTTSFYNVQGMTGGASMPVSGQP